MGCGPAHLQRALPPPGGRPGLNTERLSASAERAQFHELSIAFHAGHQPAADLPHDVDTIRAHTQEHAPRLREQAEPLFNAFLDLVGRPAGRTVLPSR